jgi:hypothetical protein
MMLESACKWLSSSAVRLRTHMANHHSFKSAHAFVRLAWRNCDGVSGIEFAIVANVLLFLMLNGIDFARYFYIKMQVENAAQIGTQAAWKACEPAKLPATILCSGLAGAIKTAIESTSLGNSVQLKSGSPSEGYYCIDAAGVLHFMGDTTSQPDDCSGVGMPHSRPGDYIKVDVTYTYTPLFSDFTVARFFSTPITSSAQMRLL